MIVLIIILFGLAYVCFQVAEIYSGTEDGSNELLASIFGCLGCLFVAFGAGQLLNEIDD